MRLHSTNNFVELTSVARGTRARSLFARNPQLARGALCYRSLRELLTGSPLPRVGGRRTVYLFPIILEQQLFDPVGM